MRVNEIWSSLDNKLIAILRGIKPEETQDVVSALIKAGIRAIEIPLNSPDAIHSIKIAVDAAARVSDAPCLIGAGTVLDVEDVRRISEVGGNLIVSPNVDEKVIYQSKALNLFNAPGVYTPSECIRAHGAGADCLKVFPASILGISGFKAYCAILPDHMPLCAVGGVVNEDFEGYVKAGASAFGLGSSLYSVGMPPRDVQVRADAAVKAWKLAMD